MEKTFFQKYGAFIIALLTFFAISVAYFPGSLKGKVLNAHDIDQHLGMASDVVYHRIMYDEEPYWMSNQFGGMPAFQTSVLYNGNQVAPYVEKIYNFLGFPLSYLFWAMLGMYTFLLAIRQNKWVSFLGAIAYGLSTYHFTIIAAGHTTKFHSIAWMGFILAGVALTLQRKYLIGIALTALALALQIYANHPQITYYTAFIIGFTGIWVIIDTLKTKQFKASGLAGAALILAAGLAFMANNDSLLGTMEYAKKSNRGGSELVKALPKETVEKHTDGGLDKDYITQYSADKTEFLTFLVPFAKGGGPFPIGYFAQKDKALLKEIDQRTAGYVTQMPAYFGGLIEGTSGPFYAGAIIVFLAVFGLFTSKSPWKWVLLASTCFAIIVSWGKYFDGFYDLLLNTLPMFNKFRVPSMVLTIVDFTLPALAVLGLSSILEWSSTRSTLTEEENKQQTQQWLKHLYTAGGIVAGICALLWLNPSLFLDFFSDSDQWTQMFKQQNADPNTINLILDNLAQARSYIVSQSALRSLGFIITAVALVWAFINYKFNNLILLIPIVLLTLGDLWSTDQQFMSDKKLVNPKNVPNPLLEPQAYDLEIMRRELVEHPNLSSQINASWAEFKKKKPSFGDQFKPMVEFKTLSYNTNYRVLPLSDDNTFSNARASMFHKNVVGYSPVKMQRINDLIGRFFSKGLNEAIMNIQKQAFLGDTVQLSATNQILNMLNMKYLTFKGNNGQTQILENKGKNGVAWFIQKLNIVTTPDDEIMSLDTINTKTTAVIHQSFMNDALKTWQYQSDTSASIQQTGYKLNHYTYNYQSSSKQFTVFSEIYDQDWHLYVDGKEQPLVRVNYVLRGALLPEGKHTIEMKYEVHSLNTKTRMAQLASFLIIALGLGALYLHFKPLKTKDSSQNKN